MRKFVASEKNSSEDSKVWRQVIRSKGNLCPHHHLYSVNGTIVTAPEKVAELLQDVSQTQPRKQGIKSQRNAS